MQMRKQSGAALVIALLIISLVTTIAATTTIRHHFMLRRLSNHLKSSQAYSYLRVAEVIATKALIADLEVDAEESYRFDHLGEVWAQKLPPFLIDGGSYGGELIDLQGKFNLNNLAGKNQNLKGSKTVPFTVEQGIFIRLLQSYNDEKLNVTYDQAVNITRAVLDWVDADSETNFSYCEDDAYSAIDKRHPHKTANMPFMSVSELRLICNMPVELYVRIKNDLTVWPRKGNSTINVNTVGEPLLRSIILPGEQVDRFKNIYQGDSYQPPPPLRKDELTRFLEQQEKGFTTWSQATSLLDYYGFWPGAPLALHSDYFMLKAKAELDGLHQRYFSILDRTGDNIHVLFRSVDDL